MKNELRVAVVTRGDDVVIFFEDGAVCFITLFVVDRERVLWSIHPSVMQAGVSSAEARFMSFPADSVARLDELQRRQDDVEEALGHVAVREVVYGVVPHGYAEEAHAEPLRAGVEYTVIVQKVRIYGLTSFRA